MKKRKIKKEENKKEEHYTTPTIVKFPRPGEERKIPEFWIEHD